MANFFRFLAVALPLSVFVLIYSVEADVLCIKKGLKANKAGRVKLSKALQVATGSTCPKGTVQVLDTSSFKGDKGDTGAAGAQGAQGPQGPAGAAGNSELVAFVNVDGTCSIASYGGHGTTNVTCVSQVVPPPGGTGTYQGDYLITFTGQWSGLDPTSSGDNKRKISTVVDTTGRATVITEVSVETVTPVLIEVKLNFSYEDYDPPAEGATLQVLLGKIPS